MTQTARLKSVDFIKAGEYAVQTLCGYRLRVKRDYYKGGWRIWNTSGCEWGKQPYATKREALTAIRESFSE